MHSVVRVELTDNYGPLGFEIRIYDSRGIHVMVLPLYRPLREATIRKLQLVLTNQDLTGLVARGFPVAISDVDLEKLK